MRTENIAYDVEGITMIGHLALPDGEDIRPGVLVCHEGPGLNDIGKEKANRLAALGYVAFALDYHGGGTVLSDRTEMMARMAPDRPPPTRRDPP